MLSKPLRLRQSKDFQALFQTGTFLKGVYLAIKFQKIDQPQNKIAVVVGVNVSKSAVKRNRLKRMVRAIIKEMLIKMETGYNIAILVLPYSIKQESVALRQDLINLLQKAKIIKLK